MFVCTNVFFHCAWLHRVWESAGTKFCQVRKLLCAAGDTVVGATKPVCAVGGTPGEPARQDSEAEALHLAVQGPPGDAGDPRGLADVAPGLAQETLQLLTFKVRHDLVAARRVGVILY